jgi:hypothetical protein
MKAKADRASVRAQRESLALRAVSCHVEVQPSSERAAGDRHRVDELDASLEGG